MRRLFGEKQKKRRIFAADFSENDDESTSNRVLSAWTDGILWGWQEKA